MKKIITLVFGISLLAGCGGGEYQIEEELARCLTNSGAVLYTTSTCPHCKDQKEMFGPAVEYLNQVVCDESSDAQEKCQNENITGVPTWVFGDGTRASGTQELGRLAERASCEIVVD